MTERAVLAVSFGTSHRDTLEKNIAAIEAELAAAFPERTVRRAFTSGMILRKLAGEGTHIDNVPEDSWRRRLEAEGYETACVLTGLGEYPAVRALFVEHARQAEQLQAEAC